jgi:WD40 repeat protein
MLNNNMDPEISNSSNNKELEGESYQIKTSMNFKTIYDISLPEQIELKTKLYNKLKILNLKTSGYDEIISNYQKLLEKYLNTRSYAENSELSRSLNLDTNIISMDQSELAKNLKILQNELNKSKMTNQENLENLNKNLLYTMNLNEKLNKYEKELSQLKPENETLKQRNEVLEKRIKELDEITKNQEKEINDLKTIKEKLEKENFLLKETGNKLLVDNKLLTTKILSIQEDTMQKMNEYNELLESAKQKKKAADLYFSEKSESFSKNTKKKLPNYMVNVEEVQIPKKLKLHYKPHSKGITSLTFNSFGSNFITTGSDNFIKLWDTSKNSETAIFSGFTGGVTEACFDHSEQFLFAGSMDKSAKLWSLKNNKLLNTFTGHIDYINSVKSLYSSERGLTGSSDRTIREWDFNTLKLVNKYNGVSIVQCLSVAPDDSFILSGHKDGTVKLWSNSEKAEKIIDLHDDGVIRIEMLKNDNQFLTLGNDLTIKLYDLRKENSIYVINDRIIPQYCQSSISISSDKKYFAVGSSKGTIYIVKLNDGTVADTIENKSRNPILSVRWRPYHSQIYVGDGSGYLTIWGTGEK